MAGRSLLVMLVVLGSVALTACGLPNSATLPAAQLFPFGDTIQGKILFVKDGNVWIWADGRARQLTAGESWRQPQWSPDGSEIAYVYRGTNFSDIFVMQADGSNTRRLTRSQSSSLYGNDWSFRPTWSPTGTQIAYVTDAETANPVVWLMNKDGSGKRQLLAVSSIQETADALAWSPDGKRLAVAAFGPEISQIVLVDVTRGTTQTLTEAPRGAIDPAWAPDSRTLAYAVRETGRMDVRLRRLDGQSEVEVTNGGMARSPTWSPDGARLAYLSARTGAFEIFVADVATDGDRLVARNERQITRDLHVDATSGLSWSR